MTQAQRVAMVQEPQLIENDRFEAAMMPRGCPGRPQAFKPTVVFFDGRSPMVGETMGLITIIKQEIDNFW